jgi:hypothetical protein
MRIIYILLAVIGLYAGFLHLQVKAHPQLQYNSFSDRLLHPLDTRLRFKVEQVDAGFGLSKDQVIQLSQEAIDIWHHGTNRDDLMVYDENAKLGIHLIYDQRQQEYDALKKVEQQLLTDEARYQRQVKNLEASHQHLESQQQRLIQHRDQINYEFQILQQRRQQPNLSAYEREQIEYEVLALQRKSESFQRELQYLQEQQSSFNLNVSMHQHGLQNHQQNIIQAQQRFPAREFHKGVFMGHQIHVYQFDAEDDLRLTLAHELGHALGLYHHHDPEALMYPVLGQQNLRDFQLRPADKTLLYNR